MPVGLLCSEGDRMTSTVVQRRTPETPDRYDFWISHSGKDQKWGEWVAWQLDQDGYKVLLDVWDFRPGASFVERMSHAASRSDRLVLVLSSSYGEAKFVRPEWANFFRRDPAARKNTIIPVRVEDVTAPEIIGDLIWVDLVGCAEEEARLRLLMGVRPDAARPDLPPPFPAGPSPVFPSTVPALWSVPALRDSPFLGRDDELEELDRLLQGTDRMVAVIGDSGVGKSRLVLEYLHRHRSEKPVVRWMRAVSHANLTAEYRRFALDLDLPVAGSTDDQTVVRAVVDWLGGERDWLVAFDDVGAAEDLSPFLPTVHEGRVVVTSENRTWRGGGAAVYELAPLTVQETSGLLRTATGDPQQLDTLAELVRGLPLAVEQAKAYLDEEHMSVPEYLRALVHLLQPAASGTAAADSVAATCGVTVEQLRIHDPGASALLRELAFLAPDDIPMALLGADGTVDEDRPVVPAAAVGPVSEDIEGWVERLHRLALVQVFRGGLSLHRSVQRQLRASLSVEEQVEGWQRALAHVDAALSYEHREPRYWQRSQRLIPHALAVAEHIPATAPVSQRLGRVLHKAGVFLARSGQSQAAMALYERALTVARDIDDRAGEAATLNSMGHSGWRVGPWEKARQYFIAATKLYDVLDAPAAKARSLNNLALVYWDEGRWAKAVTEFSKSLAFQAEAEAAGTRKSLGATRANLGHVYWDQGRWDDAVECYERARQRQTSLGNLRGQASSLNCLALVYWDQGRWHDAAEAHAEALTLFREDGDHRAVVGTLNCLGFVLSHQGRWEEAVDRHQAACAIARDLKDGHLEAISLDDMGQAFAMAVRLTEALEQLEASMRLLTEADDRHGIHRGHNHIGAVLARLQRTEEALDHHERALALATEYGARHAEAVSLVCLGRAYAMADDVTSAHNHLKRAQHLYAELGARHGSATVLNDLGLVALRRRDLELAERMFEDSLAIRLQLGNPHGEAICQANLATVHLRRGIAGRAVNLLERAFSLYRDMSNRNGEASVLLNLAAAYTDLDRPHRAEDLERRAVAATTLRDEHGRPPAPATLRQKLSVVPVDESGGLATVVVADARDRHGEPFMLTNLGLVAYTVGRWPPYAEVL
jgi:tetratricopeptide (TPR) repeat protein